MLARQIAVGFGIAFIFPLLVYYGVATFCPPPKLQEFVTATLATPFNPTPEQRNEYEAQRQKRWNSKRRITPPRRILRGSWS